MENNFQAGCTKKDILLYNRRHGRMGIMELSGSRRCVLPEPSARHWICASLDLCVTGAVRHRRPPGH